MHFDRELELDRVIENIVTATSNITSRPQFASERDSGEFLVHSLTQLSYSGIPFADKHRALLSMTFELKSLSKCLCSNTTRHTLFKKVANTLADNIATFNGQNYCWEHRN